MGDDPRRSKKAKRAHLADKEYPVEFAKPCETCQKGAAGDVAYVRRFTGIMKETIGTLEYYRGKGDYCYDLGDAHNPENPEQGNPESGIRFLNGKIEVWYKDATLSRDWSLDEQIAYLERYIAANEGEALIYEHKGDWKRLKCVIRQLNAVIPRVAAGEFDWVKVCGETIKDFVSPGAEEGETWVEALKDQVAQYKDEINMIEAEVSILRANNKKFDNEDEVVKMEEEVRAMVASKSGSTKGGGVAESNRLEEDDSKSPDHQNDDASKSIAAEKDDADKSPTQENDVASESATLEKGATSKSDPKQDGSSKVPATQKDAAAEGAVIVFHEEMVKIEPRFVKHDNKKAKKGKGKAGGATDEPPEKIMVISVVRRAAYTSPAPSDKDTSSCGDTGGQEMPTETGPDGEWTRTDMDTDDELEIPTVDEAQPAELDALVSVTGEENPAELAAHVPVTEEAKPAEPAAPGEAQPYEFDVIAPVIEEEQRRDIAATVSATGESKLAELLATALAIEEEQLPDLAASVSATGEARLAELLATSPVIEEEQRADIIAPVPVAEAAKLAEPTHAPAPTTEEAKPTELINMDAEDEKGIPIGMDADDEKGVPADIDAENEKGILTDMDANDEEGSSTTYIGADDEEGTPTDMEGVPTDMDSDNEKAVPADGDAIDEEGTSTGMDADDKEGISTGMDADDEGVITHTDSDDGGIPAETGSDADSRGQDAVEAEVAQAVENSPKLCRIFRRTVRRLVVAMAEALPLTVFLLGLKILVIEILQAHGYLESDL